MELRPELQQLLERARAASAAAYAPYSGFRVGAAVRVRDRVYEGANIENASLGLTICAERAAIARAVLDGANSIDALAVACVDAPVGSPAAERMPCGACRQVLAEFAGPDLSIVVDGAGVFTLEELLPHGFRLARPRT